MSQQITSTVDDSLKDWLETIAEDLGISEAEVQRRCFRVVRQHENPREVLQPFSDEDVTATDVRDELAALRERVAALEDKAHDSARKESAHGDRARSHGSQSVGAGWVAANADWTVAESAETDAKNAALADAYTRLRDAGQLPSSDIQDVYDDHDLSIAKSTWRGEVLGVLGTLPAIKKPGPGQSTWRYDD